MQRTTQDKSHDGGKLDGLELVLKIRGLIYVEPSGHRFRLVP